LVHGEQNEMARLKVALVREYEDNEDINMEIHSPRNTQAVELYFRGEKMAKVMGSLATKPPAEDHKLSGVLIKRGFNYHLIDPSDLSSYTELTTSSIQQRQMLKFHSPFSLLHHCLRQLSSDAEIRMLHGKKAVVVFGGAVTVIHDEVTETVSIEVSHMSLLHHVIVM
jgi:cleavage and polyadenylation specificity factor subunit 3